MPKKAPTVAGVLRKAYRLISNEKRWTKGAYHIIRDGHDCYCSMGALNVSVNGDDQSGSACGFIYPDRISVAHAALGHLQKAMWDVTGLTHRSVVVINDAPNTTHAQVKKAFRLAYTAAGGVGHP